MARPDDAVRSRPRRTRDRSLSASPNPSASATSGLSSSRPDQPNAANSDEGARPVRPAGLDGHNDGDGDDGGPKEAPDNQRIRWAPLRMPMARRQQTLAVLAHTSTIGLLVAAFFVACSNPRCWPVLALYLVYLVLSDAASSGELSLRSEWMRRLPVWNLFAAYFPAKLRPTARLDSREKYIFGYHPHGIISHGAFVAFATEALDFAGKFPGITNTLLTLDSNFRVPFYRDYALWMGLASVSNRSWENLLSKGGSDGSGAGRAITVVIGGADEALKAIPGAMRLTLNRRRGFARLAQSTGAALVPVIGFGENELYNQIDTRNHKWLNWLQLRAKDLFGFTIPLFHGRGIFNYDIGLLPFRHPLNVVVGQPIFPNVPRFKGNQDALHREYCEELEDLWNEHKHKYGFGQVTIELDKDLRNPDRDVELSAAEREELAAAREWRRKQRQKDRIDQRRLRDELSDSP